MQDSEPLKKKSFKYSNWRLTAGTCPHGGLVQIIFLSKWGICRFYVNLPGCMETGGTHWVLWHFSIKVPPLEFNNHLRCWWLSSQGGDRLATFLLSPAIATTCDPSLHGKWSSVADLFITGQKTKPTLSYRGSRLYSTPEIFTTLLSWESMGTSPMLLAMQGGFIWEKKILAMAAICPISSQYWTAQCMHTSQHT